MTADKEKVPYAKYAFANAYNLGLLGASLTVAGATQNWLLAAMGLGAEAIWMLFAPDSRLLRGAWFDKYHRARLEDQRQALVESRLNLLPRADSSRCRSLRALRDQILHLAKDNPTFTQDMLQNELGKLDQLWLSFLELCVTCKRYTDYLDSVDVESIERDLHRFQHEIEHGPKDERRELSQKNYAVLCKRRDVYGEILADLQRSRGQLALIENTFRLLADKIVTMQSPGELTGQLDELIVGVESIQKSARETERIMAGIERELAGPAL